jgi:hypothetical protein
MEGGLIVMRKVKWSIQNILISEISIRTHVNPWTGNEEDYAVIFCKPKDVEIERKQRGSVIAKTISFLLFKEEIFRRTVEGDWFSFTGEVRFGYGNTYLVATRAYDASDISVEDEDSIYYDRWEPEEEDKEELKEGDILITDKTLKEPEFLRELTAACA